MDFLLLPSMNVTDFVLWHQRGGRQVQTGALLSLRFSEYMLGVAAMSLVLTVVQRGDRAFVLGRRWWRRRIRGTCQEEGVEEGVLLL